MKSPNKRSASVDESSTSGPKKKAVRVSFDEEKREIETTVLENSKYCLVSCYSLITPPKSTYPKVEFPLLQILKTGKPTCLNNAHFELL